MELGLSYDELSTVFLLEGISRGELKSHGGHSGTLLYVAGVGAFLGSWSLNVSGLCKKKIGKDFEIQRVFWLPHQPR